jgi:hypothetical protein
MAKKNATGTAQDAMPAKEQKKQVDKHRQCTICHPNLGGVGQPYRTAGMKTYYKCDACGHNYHVEFKTTELVVRYREIESISR